MTTNIFPFFLNKSYSTEERNRIIIGMADMMQHVYNTLDDRSRPVFYMMYESFIAVVNHNANKDYKSIHSIELAHRTLFSQSPSLKFLLTLEKKSSAANPSPAGGGAGVGASWQPADIFFQDTTKSDTSILTPHQALAASLNLHGNVNLPYMEQRCQLDRYDIVQQLHDLVFFNPISGEWEEADKWLSGNIVQKMKEATSHLDEYKNGELQFAKSAIASLEGVRPAPLPFSDIDVQLGSRWVPVEYYRKFLREACDVEREDFNLFYVPQTDEFVGNVYVKWESSKRKTWAVAHRKEAGEMILCALTGNSPRFTYKNDDGKTVDDTEAIARANRIIDEVRTAWIDWVNLPKQADIRTELANLYNERFNCEVRPSYDGSFQTFPDLHLENLGIKDLYKSQKDAIWMIKRNNGGVCWHEVGSGKTLIMCVSAYEMKRIGVCNKPMIIGLKANVAQIAETFRKIYPSAKLLYTSEKDWQKKGRVEIINQIKNNDWDCIIMSHDQFGNIPQAKETEMHLLLEEVESLDDVLKYIQDNKRGFAGRMLSNLQKSRDKMRAQLLDLQEKLRDRTDDTDDFNTLGIDHIFVDESQAFKNLKFFTRNTRVGGIGNPEGSQKAWKLLTAIRDIQSRKGTDLCATFLSGTVVSNSLTELYLIFKYLRPRALAAQDIHSFDAWATNFCEKKTDYEFGVAGQLHSKERFASYINVPELSQFLRQITDYRTTEMCGIDAPKGKLHFESAPPTPNQEVMLKRLLEFVNSKKWSALGIQRDCPANLDKALMLTATDNARKTSLDPRLLDGCKTFGDEENNKVRRCADNIFRIWKETKAQKGTQFVFSDTGTYDKSKWNLHSAIRDVLVNEIGIPAKEIDFIYNYSTDKQRLALFDRMNRGEVRILFGSTAKLGTGVNAQQRAVAVHHLDIPWKPADLEQRNGRACRQGNWVAKERGNEVDIYMYATERTLDAYKFNLLKVKATFIEQLNNGSLGTRRIDESVADDSDAVSFAEFMSVLSGNQDLLKKAKLDAKIMALEKERLAFLRERNEAVDRIAMFRKKNIDDEAWIKEAKSDLATAAVTDETILSLNAPFALVPTGSAPVPNGSAVSYTSLAEAGKALFHFYNTFNCPEYTLVGTCGNLRLAAIKETEAIKFFIVGTSGTYYSCVVNRSSHEAAARSPYQALLTLSQEIQTRSNLIAHRIEQIPALESITQKEWQGAADLADLKQQVAEINARLDAANKPKEDAAA